MADLVAALDEFQRKSEVLEASEVQAKAEQDAVVSDLGSVSLLGSLILTSFKVEEWTDALEEGDFDDKSWAAVASKYRDSISCPHRVMMLVEVAISRIAKMIDGGLQVGLN